MIIPRQRHNSLTWFGTPHSKCCRAGPTQGPSLPDIHPRTSQVGVEYLCPGDLSEANGGRIRNVAAESTVHFLIYPLWFDGFFIVMRLALQLTFTCGTAGRPGGLFRY